MNYPLYRETLCPRMWHMDEDGYKLDVQVRKMLLKVAADFVKKLKEDHELNIKIHDLVIIGSVANYNWTDYSDIDLHIIVDFNDLDMTKNDAQTMFDAIKTSWNLKHDIKMKGHDVEIYVQDIDHVAVSTAEYSVLKDKWIKEPKKESPKFNKDLIKRKYNEYKKKIDDLIKNHDEVKLKKLLEKLYNYRQSGLDKAGELSEENIVFKILRAFGHLDKLKNNIDKIYDKKVSVKEIDIMEGSADIAKTVYQHAINTHQHFDRSGNSATMYGNPTPNQMKYLKDQTGSFTFGVGNTKVYFSNDPYEPNKIKFTWNF
jgi:hypothetical protein